MSTDIRLRVAAGIIGGSLLLHPIAPATAQEALLSTEARLDALDVRITRLEDMEAIERLQKTYGYLVDKAQWEPLSRLFSDDGTLEIGGRGVYTGRERVLAYMQTGFGQDGTRAGVLMNHMQFQPVASISEDGQRGWVRARAYVMSPGGWGLPLYENEYVKEDGVWKIRRLHGPFIMYTSWEGWGKNATPNTWPGDRDLSPPDLPPSVVYLTYPSYYIVPYHYPNPVTGRRFEAEIGQAGVLTPQR